MKRRFTQKVKQVPSCAADSFDTLLKLSLGKQQVGAAIPTESNRRARTSAAMIGLAISMGTTGLLLPQQGDEAMAVEPIATEPNAPILPSVLSTSVLPVPVKEAKVVAVSTLPTTEQPVAALEKLAPMPVVEHKVKEGETLWALSKTYEVQPEAIAASNNIKPSAVLPVGQKLKIPPVNGIVHEVKAGETVESLSKSYGVEPIQLQASVPVSESSQLQIGESVTVPGKVNDLLKARQDLALNNLKEQRNRLNDSLAELRSEESTNLSNEATVPTETASTTQSITPVTIPSAVLKPKESVASVPTSPVVIPVPTPEIAATPRSQPKGVTQFQSPVVIPVPTPEIAATPRIEPKGVTQLQSPVVLPAPTPELAASPGVEYKAGTVPELATAPVTNAKTPATPQVPRSVVMQPFVAAASANLYQVKPGDTVDAIARRYNVSRSELIQVNGLNNPNILNLNQQLRIPQAQSASAVNETVTLLPGINSNPSSSTSGQEQLRGAVPTEPLSQPQSLARPVLAQSTVVAEAQPNSTVVVNTQSNQSANSQSNLYIEKLRADILKLREEYQNGKESTQASAPLTIVVPTVTKPVTANPNSTSTSSRVNPEFKPNQHNESVQAGLGMRRQQPQTQRGPIKIEVPPPETAGTPSQDLVATAPAPADSYNPATRTPVGETVSPGVPSLSAPDMYLPGSQTQFNGYIWPTKGVLTSGYGWRWGRMHKGIDIAAPVGTPVVAAAPGVVVTAGWNSGGYGNLVEIQHPDGSLTLYAHNNRILVRRGQEVAQGQQISEMGSTGYSTGPHCHFEVHPTGRGAVNPIAFLPKK